jgi:dTDP-4-dehydrorhamnose reductase
VFDGSQGRPYVESDAPSPLCVYGQSKMQAEQSVLAANDRGMVVRTSAFFGPWDRYNFAHAVVSSLSDRRAFQADKSTVVSPTYVPHLVHEVLDLLIDDAAGVWHVANRGQSSWYDFARSVAKSAGLDERRIEPLSSGERKVTALRSEKGIALPAVEEAVEIWSRHRSA